MNKIIYCVYNDDIDHINHIVLGLIVHICGFEGFLVIKSDFSD